jgi:hypothetical protein
MNGRESLFRGRAWKRIAIALIALLALRSLVPAGFMAIATDAGAQLVFCEPGAALGHGHAHHHSPGAATDPGCPYAQSSGPAPLPTLPALAADVRPLSIVPSVSRTSPTVRPGPRRQQTPRGPPALA